MLGGNLASLLYGDVSVMIIDKIYVVIADLQQRVTALDSRQNLVFTQYLENELTE